MWASEFDKMDLGSSSYNDVERIGEARPVEDTSNSNKVKKRGEKLQQETRKKSSSHAQRAVKEICEAVGNCSGKDTKSISMAAKAFGAQAHSFKSLDIPTAGGSGLQKTTTNHTKAIGSHETLRASQVGHGYFSLHTLKLMFEFDSENICWVFNNSENLIIFSRGLFNVLVYVPMTLQKINCYFKFHLRF